MFVCLRFPTASFFSCVRACEVSRFLFFVPSVCEHYPSRVAEETPSELTLLEDSLSVVEYSAEQ
jgi:hypothetical protein